jgi:hypothetical protein
MTQSNNPLRQFFRQPAIYIKLPSDGANWPAGSIDIPHNREIPVYPMTAIDEITYRTPDALFNGQAVINVVQSCVPAIKNAWHMPNIDINTVLIAIRIASHGHELEIESTCPACNEAEEYSLDLRAVLDKIKTPDYNNPLDHGDLQIVFAPLSYEMQNHHSQKQFEQQQLLNSITRSDLSEEEKLARINAAMSEITKLTIEVLAASIAGIKTPDMFVDDQVMITEFLNNCDRLMFNAIRDQIIELRKDSDLQPVHLNCRSCSHEYDQALNLDMTNFFEPAS